MCKHNRVTFVEIIEAYHQRIFEGNEYYKNNEYEGRIKVSVYCNDCGFKKIITYKNKDKLPRWLLSRIELMKQKDDWFFN